jgi:NADPH:quinone reductase-like Zn-dependent oxidoreductase
MAADALHPRIALRVPLAETAAAHLAVESGAMIGNVVIEID